MSSNSENNDTAGTYWVLTSERRRPKREFPSSSPKPKHEPTKPTVSKITASKGAQPTALEAEQATSTPTHVSAPPDSIDAASSSKPASKSVDYIGSVDKMEVDAITTATEAENVSSAPPAASDHLTIPSPSKIDLRTAENGKALPNVGSPERASVAGDEEAPRRVCILSAGLDSIDVPSTSEYASPPTAQSLDTGKPLEDDQRSAKQAELPAQHHSSVLGLSSSSPTPKPAPTVIDISSLPPSLEVLGGGAPKSPPKDSTPKTRPVTRQMAMKSGEEIWPWMKSITANAQEYEDDEFVVDEVEKDSQENPTTFDGLQPPRSLNYLEPSREQAKLARKSDLELLKQSRLARQHRSSENPPTVARPGVLPIFESPADSPPPSLYKPPKTSREPSISRPNPFTSNRQEALEPKRKRQREFDSLPSDYLPSFGPDFIIDDGSGYGVDPMYKTPQPRPSSNVRLPPSPTSPPATGPTSNRRTQPTLLQDHSQWDTSDSYSIEANNSSIFGRSATASRQPPIRSSSDSSSVQSDSHAIARLDDPVLFGLERSNPESVVSHSTTFSGSHSTNFPQNMMTTSGPTTPMAPKLRLTVLVKDEKLFISCPPDSTFEWLQQEAISKYRRITRMEVELDHLETNFGARLLPGDQIREYMNDLETVVALIKESRPLDLVSLYSSDCLTYNLPENQEIVERLKLVDLEAHAQHHGAHKLLPLSKLSLTPLCLSSLRGIFNLHSFFAADLSSNHLSSSSLCEVMQEMARSNAPELLQKFQISDNLLGLSLEVESIRTVLSKFSGLTCLDLSENTLNDRAIGALVPAVLKGCPNLIDLDLSSNFFGYVAMKTIGASTTKLRQLKALNVSRNPLRKEGFCSLLDSLGEDSPIETLNLAYTNVFSEDLHEFMDEQPFGATTTLDESVAIIARNLRRLKHFSIRGCPIDTQTFPMLLPALCLSLRHLQTIDMADCSLVAQDLRLLRTLVQSTSLTTLNLAFNRLSSSTTSSNGKKLLLEFAMSVPQGQKLHIMLDHCGFDKNDRVELAAQISSTRPLLHIDFGPESSDNP